MTPSPASSSSVFSVTETMNTTPMKNRVQKPWMPLATRPASMTATPSRS